VALEPSFCAKKSGNAELWRTNHGQGVKRWKTQLSEGLLAEIFCTFESAVEELFVATERIGTGVSWWRGKGVLLC
jgi:hypothetical protein